MTRSTNLAARAGRWSAAHWKSAVLGWLAFVAIAVVLGQMAGTNELREADTYAGETARAEQILSDAGFTSPASESVLVQSETLTTRDPAFRAAVADVATRVQALPEVTEVRSPFAPGNRGQVSADGGSALVPLDIRGEAEDAVDLIAPVQAAVADAQGTHPDLLVAQFGQASAAHELDETLGEDFERA